MSESSKEPFLCIHGHIIKFGDCYFCKIEKRIESLENWGFRDNQLKKLESYIPLIESLNNNRNDWKCLYSVVDNLSSALKNHFERSDIRYKECLDKLAELSMKINSIQSECREILIQANEKRDRIITDKILENIVIDLKKHIEPITEKYKPVLSGTDAAYCNCSYCLSSPKKDNERKTEL